MGKSVVTITGKQRDNMPPNAKLNIFISKEFECEKESEGNFGYIGIVGEPKKYISGWAEKGYDYLVNFEKANKTTNPIIYEMKLSETNESYFTVNGERAD